MKKGCFFSGIIFLTITIGIGFYLYKRYSPDIKNFGKEKILQMSINEFDEKIDKLADSKYKDSLKIYLNNQAEKIRKYDFDKAMNKFGNIMDQVKFFIHDNQIDSVEFSALKNLAIKDERPTQN